MAKVGVGLDIGTSSVRVAAVATGSGARRLEGFSHVGLEPGVVVDGDLVDLDALADAIAEAFQDARVPRKSVVMGLTSQRVVARQVDLPWLPQKEMRNALPLMAGDLLPIPVDESVMDFLPAEDFVEDDGTRVMRGLLVAASESLVSSALEAAHDARIVVDQIDAGPLGALRAVGHADSEQAEAVVDIGADVSSVVVHEEGQPKFVRVLSRGGNGITDGVAEALALDWVAADTWKCAAASLWPTMNAADQARTRRTMESATESLVDEIRSSIGFYMTSTESPRPGRIILTGGGATTLGLDFEIKQALSTEVLVARPMSWMDVGSVHLDPGQLEALDPGSATAVGLALAGTR